MCNGVFCFQLKKKRKTVVKRNTHELIIACDITVCNSAIMYMFHLNYNTKWRLFDLRVTELSQFANELVITNQFILLRSLPHYFPR